LFWQDAADCKLHEAEEIGWVVFPTHQEPTLPLNPGKVDRSRTTKAPPGAEHGNVMAAPL